MLVEALPEQGYAAYRARLSVLLDIPHSASDLEIHTLISRGFPASKLMSLSTEGMVSSTERDQIIPLETLKFRIERGQNLTLEESDRLFKSAHILSMALAVFGNPDKARRWLNKPKERFDGRTPMQMLTTQQGFAQVEAMLLQITEGFGF
jgi:putative toxin-antitoxin system antitoxin component (TIGR02293 family)